MQEGAIERVALFEIAIGRAVPVAIVTQHGMTDRSQVATNLVRSPDLWNRADHAMAAERRQPAIAGARRITDAPFAQIARDRAFHGWHAANGCKIHASAAGSARGLGPWLDLFGATH